MNFTRVIPILLTSDVYQAQAQQWATQLNSPVITHTDQQHPFMLVFDENGLALQQTNTRELPMRVDFVEGAARHRRLYGGGRQQMLAKAIGLNNKIKPFVLDATAGLGRDAFVLASLGCNVQLVERSPIVHALLQDGLARAAAHADTQAIVERMSLTMSNAADYLHKSDQKAPEVVYLDPMFPESNKTALVKKEMRLFHDLIGSDGDADELLQAALNKAIYRVVVKRPRLAPPLANQAPTYTLEGKANRFDIYALKSMSGNHP